MTNDSVTHSWPAKINQMAVHIPHILCVSIENEYDLNTRQYFQYIMAMDQYDQVRESLWKSSNGGHHLFDFWTYIFSSTLPSQLCHLICYNWQFPFKLVKIAKRGWVGGPGGWGPDKWSQSSWSQVSSYEAPDMELLSPSGCGLKAQK